MNLFEAITGRTSRMSHVSRYSSFRVNRRENVAEHSWWVAFIAMLVSHDLRPEIEHDMAKVLVRAACHDLSECISGDVIRSYKHSTDEIRNAMQDADERNMEELIADYGDCGSYVFLDWINAKDDSIEGAIVSFADMASVAFYCREEDRSGNRAIRPVLKEMYERWFHKYHDHLYLSRYNDQMFPRRLWSDMLREEIITAHSMFPSGIPMMRHHAMDTVDHDFTDDGPGAA